MITRDKLERHQIGVYAAALIMGGIFGIAIPEMGSAIQFGISPLIAILLFGMFAQIPFLQLRDSLSNLSFLGALLLSNFVAVPLVVWGLVALFPQPPAMLIGILLVLLTPCIDYVIVFTQIGRGNEKLMLIATPVLFVVQMILLPFYLWLFLGESSSEIVYIGPFAEAFVFLILLPLLMAIALQRWSLRNGKGKSLLHATTWLPVPLMAFVLFVVVASQIGKIANDLAIIAKVIPIYLLFHFIMPFLSRLIAQWFRLDAGAGRAVIFSSGTRNSLVVLPLAFALPEDWATAAAAVIVTQTIVELISELVYVRVVPFFYKNRSIK